MATIKTSENIGNFKSKDLSNEKQEKPLNELVKPGKEEMVGYWLIILAILVYITICFGAYTRLIKLGHSFTGLHPLGWKGGYEALKKNIEHYLWHKHTDHSIMTFLEEYLSVTMEKIIELSFIIPFSYFIVRGYLMPKLRNRCLGVIGMQILQTLIGSWILANEHRHKVGGENHRIIVSTYRMFLHWNSTMAIFAVLFWNGLSLLRHPQEQILSSASMKDMISMRSKMMVCLIINILNFATGVMVAGIDGSRKFNTFPDMNGEIIPSGYLSKYPFLKDIFENVATAQFHHRLFAVGTYIAAVYLFLISRRKNLTSEAKRGLLTLFIIANLQLVDGILVLKTQGHWLFGFLHQSNAIWILGASLFANHAFRNVITKKPNQTNQQLQSSQTPSNEPIHEKVD